MMACGLSGIDSLGLGEFMGDAIVASLIENSISILCAFIIAFNIVPLTMPVYATMKATTRFVLTGVFGFILFSQITQGKHPDVMFWVPIAVFLGLVAAYFRFRAPKTPS